MTKQSKSAEFLLEDLSHKGKELSQSLRGLTIGKLIQMIRNQLGMSQK